MNKNEENIKVYTAEELAEMRRRGEDRSDWVAAAAITDEELERLIAEDPDEQGLEIDWSRATLVRPASKAPVNLRAD